MKTIQKINSYFHRKSGCKTIIDNSGIKKGSRKITKEWEVETKACTITNIVEYINNNNYGNPKKQQIIIIVIITFLPIQRRVLFVCSWGYSLFACLSTMTTFPPFKQTWNLFSLFFWVSSNDYPQKQTTKTIILFWRRKLDVRCCTCSEKRYPITLQLKMLNKLDVFVNWITL